MKTQDGSRLFFEFPSTRSPKSLASFLRQVPRCQVTEFITDHQTETWIDFIFQGHRFSVHQDFEHYAFYANDPHSSQETLEAIRSLCEAYLKSSLSSRWSRFSHRLTKIFKK